MIYNKIMQMTRSTKYTTAILETIEKSGHATNAELLEALRAIFPELSATTVHRATARLCELGKIGEAPTDSHGAMRFDFKTFPHDHFMCTLCGGIRDLDVADALVLQISKALGGCQITGRLIIQGSCEKCFVKSKAI
jgi:Fur family peroxide stress response transcriptional regulator